MFEASSILVDCPVLEGRINIAPMEAALAVRRIAEVVDFVAGSAKSLNDRRVELVSPATCYIDFCHSVGILNFYAKI